NFDSWKDQDVERVGVYIRRYPDPQFTFIQGSSTSTGPLKAAIGRFDCQVYVDVFFHFIFRIS
ncbi:Uncharacterized protein APZ42_000326, partial [Daphnia magna]